MVSRRVFFLFGDLGASGCPTNLTQRIHRCINKSFCQHGIVLVSVDIAPVQLRHCMESNRLYQNMIPCYLLTKTVDMENGRMLHGRHCAGRQDPSHFCCQEDSAMQGDQTHSEHHKPTHLGHQLVQPPAGEAQGCQGGCMLGWRQSGVGPGRGWRRRLQRKHRRRC